MFRKSTIFYASLFIVSLTSFSIITSCSTVYSPDIIESDGPHHFVEPLDWDPFSLQIDTEPEEHASNVFMHNALSSIDIPAPPYAIQVRVIVEVNSEGVPARTPEDIAKDFNVAAQFFIRAGMVFVIQEQAEVSIDKDIPRMRDYRNDAMMNSDHMSVYYIFGHSWLTPLGLSSFPWDDQKHGIIMNGKYADYFSLAHEIGHYFGLFHTFDEGPIKGDFVRDTYDQDEWNEEEQGLYASYNNLMNYSKGDTRTLTAGQIERVKFFLIMFRSDHIIRLDSPGQFDDDAPVKSPELPNPVFPLFEDPTTPIIQEE